MRDAEADTVADGRGGGFVGRVPAQVGVLVVQGGDGPARGHIGGRHRTARGALDRDRHLEVVGDVALANREDRQARLGPRLHQRPHFHRRAQALALRAADALVDDLEVALVVPVVVRHVAARTQQPAHRATEHGREAARHQIEDRGATGGDQHLVGLEPAVRRALACDRFDAVHQRRGERRVVRGGALQPHAFVALDADELHIRARMHARGQRDRLGMRAATGAAAGQADLQHHVERPAVPVRDRPALDQIELRGRVDEERDAQIGVAREQRLDAVQVGIADDLVRDQRVARTRGHADAQLLHGCEREPPRTGIELALEQLRRHRRLAVWREIDLPGARLLLHPREVVIQRLAPDQRDRQRQVSGQHVPAEAADGAAAHRVVGVRKAFEARIEQRVEQVVHAAVPRVCIACSLGGQG